MGYRTLHIRFDNYFLYMLSNHSFFSRGVCFLSFSVLPLLLPSLFCPIDILSAFFDYRSLNLCVFLFPIFSHHFYFLQPPHVVFKVSFMFSFICLFSVSICNFATNKKWPESTSALRHVLIFVIIFAWRFSINTWFIYLVWLVPSCLYTYFISLTEGKDRIEEFYPIITQK